MNRLVWDPGPLVVIPIVLIGVPLYLSVNTAALLMGLVGFYLLVVLLSRWSQ